MSVDDFKLPAFAPSPPKAPVPAKPTVPVPEGGLPASPHMEIAILGVMMLEEQAILDATAKLKAEDFLLDSHRKIFRCIADLAEKRRDVDTNIVLEELLRRNELDDVGGRAYVAFLTEGIPRNFRIDSYIRVVKDKSLMRKLMGIFHDAEMRTVDQAEDALEILKDIEGRLAEVAQSSLRTRDRKILIGGVDFLQDTPTAVEWAVEGLIQRGGNGIVVGDPGSAKSYSTLDLAYHLVAGVEWMGHAIPERLKVAYIAREDHAGLTQQRGMSLMKGYDGWPVGTALAELDVNEWLYYNTRAQSETFSLQNEMDVMEIIDAFKTSGIQIAFFDVFRRLWEGDENDNKEVAKVLAVLTRIQTECDCSVALVHHLNKSEGGTIFQRIRGAGSIYGWREWAFGISIENPEDNPKDRIRKIVFETKAATPASPVYYCFDGEEGAVRLATCAAPAASYKKGKKSKAEEKDEDYVKGWWE